MNNRDRVMESVFELIISKGETGLSVNDIIKELNMTKGGFYYYFKSRDELMEEMIDRFMLKEMKKEIAEARDSITDILSVKDRLKRCCFILPKPVIADDSGNRVKEYDSGSFFILLYGLMDKYPALKEGYMSFREENLILIRETLLEGIGRGIIKKCICPQSYSELLLAVRDGIVALSMIDENIDIEKKLETSFETAWNEIYNEVA